MLSPILHVPIPRSLALQAAAGSGAMAVADAYQAHFAVLLATYIVQLFGRSAIPLVTSFVGQLIIALATEAAASPLGTVVDAAVSAAATDEGGYGRARLWASVGWVSSVACNGSKIIAMMAGDELMLRCPRRRAPPHQSLALWRGTWACRPPLSATPCSCLQPCCPRCCCQ